jgi:hypothetical protein
MAPEVYEDRENERKSRDPKTYVLSFVLILYEILSLRWVFHPTCSAAAIIRRAMSAKASDHPVIPVDLPVVLRDLIAKSWLSAASKRQCFDGMWQRLRKVGFKVFLTVEAEFVPLCGELIQFEKGRVPSDAFPDEGKGSSNRPG